MDGGRVATERKHGGSARLTPVTVVDYGRGNLFSIGQALRHLGAAPDLTDDPAAVASASRIILPGVGAFGDAMESLRRRDLAAPLREAAARGTPLLGICLGMQMFTTASEEFGRHEGLNLVPGTVRRMPDAPDGPSSVRIPNVGWRRLDPRPASPLAMSGLADAMVYFVHSYALWPDDPVHVEATTDVNGTAVPAACRNGSIVGWQFHPEKSGPAGLALLGWFLGLESDT